MWTVCMPKHRTCAPIWDGGIWPKEKRWRRLGGNPGESNRMHLSDHDTDMSGCRRHF